MTAKRPAGPEHEHLTWSEIEDFFLRTEQPEERKPLYHLLARCEACRQAAQPIPQLYGSGLVDGQSSWLEIEMAISEWQAPALWDELTADFPDLPEETDTAVETTVLRGDDRWPTWGLCVWLVKRSLVMDDEDAETALRWARWASLGALELPPSPPIPAPWVEEQPPTPGRRSTPDEPEDPADPEPPVPEPPSPPQEDLPSLPPGDEEEPEEVPS